LLAFRVLQVTYESLSVDDGNELTPTQVKDPPTVKWAADDDSYYLLCMTGTQAAGDISTVSDVCLSVLVVGILLL
jgi:hypothetical protein